MLLHFGPEAAGAKAEAVARVAKMAATESFILSSIAIF
jgi:hypothetical protein